MSESITLSAYDIYGNLQIQQSDVFQITFYLNSALTTDTAVIAVQSNGVYSATYTLKATGDYSMIIKVQPNGSGSFSDIAGSPFLISWSDTTTDPQKTVLSGTGLTSAIAGIQSIFTAKLYDIQGNARTTGGDTVTATLYSGATSVGSTWVTDNEDGTYQVQYQANIAGTYTVTVVVNGDTANNKTSTVTLIAGDPDPELSTLTFPSGITIGTASTLSIVAKDQFGNLITSQQIEIAYELIGNHGLVSGNVPVKTLSSALYEQSLTIPVPTSTSVSEWGPVGVNAYFLISGLNAYYYSNRWFASTPVLVQRGTQVNVDWSTGDIIPNFASDYVSVKWTGFLKPTYSKAFIIIVRVNDGVRLTIGETVLIDQLNQTVADGGSLTYTSPTILLSASNYIPITVEYYDITGDAHIILEWLSASQSQEVIPASQFYSQKDGALPISGTTFTSSSIYSPMIVTSVMQSTDPTTFSASALTIKWTAPSDVGCSSIIGYKITYVQGSTSSTASVGVVTTTTLSSLTPGVSTVITITADNSVGNGVPSTAVTLIPSALPSAPGSISLSAYQTTSLTLQWTAPTNTGIGDSTTITITQYRLQVDYGYGSGFQDLSNQTSLTFTHNGLIAGQKLVYRVAASNFLGQGPYSSSYVHLNT